MPWQNFAGRISIEVCRNIEKIMPIFRIEKISPPRRGECFNVEENSNI